METYEEYVRRKKEEEESGECGLLGLAFIVVVIGCSFLLYPGAMLLMFLDSVFDVEIKSTFWFWFWTVSISLVVFAFCQFDWKKYLTFDGILVTTITIISWCVDSFKPLSYTLANLFHFEG